MVIIFQSEQARRHLLEEGFVITFRKNKRKDVVLTDWMTDKRCGKKLADVKIFTLCQVEPSYFSSEMRIFSRFTGFKDREEWLHEIANLNHGIPPAYGWLYLVVVRD